MSSWVEDHAATGQRRRACLMGHLAEFGRRPVELDLRPAVAMLEAGHGIKDTARAVRLSTSTLRRRLQEAGEWPRRAVGESVAPAAR